MRWVQGFVPLILLPVVLAACTGTTSSLTPLLLVVSRVTTGSQPQVVLVEDAFNARPPSSAQTTPPAILDSTALDLPYDAVASDVVDRTGSRNVMYVLTRALNTGSNPDSALVKINLSGIDPGNPSSFANFHEVGTPIQLTGGTNPIFSSQTDAWCFSGITVSSTGRYVYLLDDSNACLASPAQTPTSVRIYQLDTSQTPIESTLVASPTAGAFVPTVPFDDQSATNERLYALAAGVTDAQLYSWPVPYKTAAPGATDLGTLAGQAQQALESNGTALVCYTNPDPSGPPGSNVLSSLEAFDLQASAASTPIDTIDGTRAMAVDPTGTTQQVVVAGYQQIGVHSSPSGTGSTPVTTPTFSGFDGVEASIDFNNSYAYVLGSGAITRLDLTQVVQGSSGWYQYFPYASGLSLPTDASGRHIGILTWTRAPTP